MTDFSRIRDFGIRVVLVLACVMSALAFQSMAEAQTYPTRPVKLVVPFAPGGVADAVARVIARSLSERLGQTFVVENKAGANGGLAAQFVATADPDGYTLLLGETGPNAINPSYYSKLPYDARKDFVPIVRLSKTAGILLASPASNITSAKEMIERAKAAPGKMNYASAGAGHLTHVQFEAIKTRTGIDVVHIPYKGGAPALSDLLANVVDFNIVSVSTAQQLVAEGKVRPIAVSSEHRVASLPEVPTFIEVGFSDTAGDGWHGLFAPTGTPQAIVAKLNEAANAALQSKDVITILHTLGVEPAGGSPEEFRNFVNAQMDFWANVITQANIRRE